jgi:hypothetical protein
MKFWIIGGITSKFATLNAKFGKKYNTNYASIDLLDFENQKIEKHYRYLPDSSIRSEDLGRDIRYTSATIKDDYIYLCTPTQVCIHRLSDMELIKIINHKWFNDVHHVNIHEGNILVANTGLDSIIIFDEEYKFKNIISTNDVEVWSKFDKATDYRQIASTKPHVNHPNFVFTTGSDIWATRFHNKDALNLNNRKEVIDIGVGKPHDGHVIGDKIYFTTINGWIVIADSISKKILNRIDLNEIDKRNRPLGWCRSLSLVNDYLYVGFTRLRRTKMEDNLRWIKEKFTGNMEPLPSRIAKYDLKNRQLVDEYVVPEGYTDLIFSIIPA